MKKYFTIMSVLLLVTCVVGGQVSHLTGPDDLIVRYDKTIVVQDPDDLIVEYDKTVVTQGPDDLIIGYDKEKANF